MSNIYDEVMALPRAHRLALAGWILRNNPTPDRQWGRILGISRQAVAKRESKELNNCIQTCMRKA